MRRERNTGERCTTVILIAMILWLPGLVSDAAGATAKRRLANVEAVVTPQEGAVGQKFSFKLKYDVINADGGELANVEVVETAVVSGPEVKQLADHVSRVTGLRDKATVRMEEWSAGFSQPGSYQWSYSLDANGFVGTGGIVDFRVTREEQKSPATIAPAPPTTSGNPIVTGSTSHKVLATGATGGVMARKNGGAWQDLKQDLELATGDEIACDPDGEVTLVFSPGPMRCALRPGTQVKVASLRRPQGAVWPALQLSVGEIAVEGSQESGQSAVLAIQSPAAVASGGPGFTVRHNDKKQLTTVTAREGEVLVTPTNQELRPVTLGGGQQVTATPDIISAVTAAPLPRNLPRTPVIPPVPPLPLVPGPPPDAVGVTVLTRPGSSQTPTQFKPPTDSTLPSALNYGTLWLQRTLTQHSGVVNAVAFSADSKMLASGSQDTTVKLWNVETGELLRTLTPHWAAVNAVVFAPDAATVASGSWDKAVRLWDTRSGQLRQQMSGHGASVSSLAFAPDGRKLASGSDDKTIIIWDVTTGKALHTLSGHSGRVRSIAFAPDGRRLISGADDKTVIIWDVETAKPIHTLNRFNYAVAAVGISPDGKTLAAGSGATAWLYDLETAQLVRALAGSTTIVALAFAPDGKTLAGGNDDGTITLWQTDTGALKTTLTEHKGRAGAVAFSPNGMALASGSRDGTAKLWRR